MIRTCALIGLLMVLLPACEQKPAGEAQNGTAAQHINTNRAGFKAAGKAAKQIENKGEDRLKAADEAMKAGE